jgi:hypothetical protein
MMYPSGYGMAALVGLNETQVSGLVEAVCSEAHPVFVGNVNAPRQIVIAGCIDGMKEVLRRAVELRARKAELLVSLFPLTARYCNRSHNLSGNSCDRCKFVIRGSSMSPMSKRVLFVRSRYFNRSGGQHRSRSAMARRYQCGARIRLSAFSGNAARSCFERPRPRELVGGRGIPRRFRQHRQTSQTCSKLKSLLPLCERRYLKAGDIDIGCWE